MKRILVAAVVLSLHAGAQAAWSWDAITAWFKTPPTQNGHKSKFI